MLASSNLEAAAAGLCDADAVAHADALVARSAGVRAAITALPPRPVTASMVALEVTPDAEAALLGAIAGLGAVVVRGEPQQQPPVVTRGRCSRGSGRMTVAPPLMRHKRSGACDHSEATVKHHQSHKAIEENDLPVHERCIASGDSTEGAGRVRWMISVREPTRC